MEMEVVKNIVAGTTAIDVYEKFYEKFLDGEFGLDEKKAKREVRNALIEGKRLESFELQALLAFGREIYRGIFNPSTWDMVIFFWGFPPTQPIYTAELEKILEYRPLDREKRDVSLRESEVETIEIVTRGGILYVRPTYEYVEPFEETTEEGETVKDCLTRNGVEIKEVEGIVLFFDKEWDYMPDSQEYGSQREIRIYIKG